MVRTVGMEFSEFELLIGVYFISYRFSGANIIHDKRAWSPNANHDVSN